MKKIIVFALAVIISFQLSAQNTGSLVSPKNNKYTESVSELIFSWGNVAAPPLNPSSILRFSCFLHLGEQYHIDFNNHTGFYTGLSLRNVGMINKLNDSVKIKQRVYTIGIPAAFKFGNMHGTFFAAGAEAEFAINYKQKVFLHDEKSKTNIWFSDRTDIFLPSVFGEIRFKQGGYIKFKYYLTDFLTSGNQYVNVPGVVYHPTKSQLMYISLGYAINNHKYKQMDYHHHKVSYSL